MDIGLISSILAIGISSIAIFRSRLLLKQNEYEQLLDMPKITKFANTTKDKLQDEFDKKLKQELYFNLKKVVENVISDLDDQIVLSFTYDDWPEKLRYTNGLIPYRNTIVKNIKRSYNCGMRQCISTKRLNMFLDKDSALIYDIIKVYKQVLKELEEKGFKISFSQCDDEKNSENDIFVIIKKV